MTMLSIILSILGILLFSFVITGLQYLVLSASGIPESEWVNVLNNSMTEISVNKPYCSTFNF